ncbi:MAG: transporter substrate-binding domain-containing protein [Oscillospiraceae bacterium]|nr:transporter substrate-binding domain-containing protein [Oscillospiraceae bacterium]
MCFSEDGRTIIGFDVDLANSIAKRLDVSLKLQPIKSKERIEFIISNKIDACIAKLNHTKSRDNLIDFSVSYLQDCKKILMNKESIGTIGNLVGKDIAYAIDTSTAIEIEKCFKELNLAKPNFVAYSSDAQAYNALKHNLVAGYASDEIIINHFMQNETEKAKYQFHPKVCCYSYFCVGVSENDSEWLNEINNILLDIYDSGEYEDIFYKWFDARNKKFLRPFERWSS